MQEYSWNKSDINWRNWSCSGRGLCMIHDLSLKDVFIHKYRFAIVKKNEIIIHRYVYCLLQKLLTRKSFVPSHAIGFSKCLDSRRK